MLKTIHLTAGDRKVTLTGESELVSTYRKSFDEQIDFKEASETFFTSVFEVTSEYLDKAERLAREVGLLPIVVD